MNERMSAENQLIIAAAVLSRINPQPWAGFMRAFVTYNQYLTSNCIQSPLDNLPVAQGRAQATAHLFELFANCLSSADKLEGKK
jgi:hypothetical protein